MASRKKDTMWDDTETETLNPAAPSVQHSISKLKWTRRGLFVMAFIATPLTFLMWIQGVVDIANGDHTPKASNVTSLSVNESAGKAPAIEAITTWMASDPSPLPGGRIVAWNGYETLPRPAVDAEKAKTMPTYNVEIHHFTLATDSDAGPILFDSSVQVLVDDILGTRVIGTPTLVPRVPSSTAGWTSDQPWLGYPSSQVPQSVTDAVTAWATAYTSGKPEALRLVVSDPDLNHSYLPLTGATVKDTAVVTAANVPRADPKAKPNQMLVRVTLALAWGEQTAPPIGEAQPQWPLATYDLLVNGADTASPQVVAWGGPGSGPSLTKYGNAITSKQIQSGPAPSGTPAPSTSPAPADETTDEAATK